MQRVARDHPELVQAVLAEVAGARADDLPRGRAALEHDLPRSTTEWGWNWSLVKAALEHLFWAGQISSAGRTAQFERRYAALERVLPRAVAAQAASPAARPSDDEAFRELMRIAARAHGIGTEQCLRDYFRLKPEQARPALAELVADGGAAPGRGRGLAPPGLPAPRRAAAAAGARRGAAQSRSTRSSGSATAPAHLYGFDYRLEIYVPAPQRVHGYYVLPFLYGDTLVARVDLKADRAAGRLRRARGALGARGATGGGPPRWSATSGSWPTGSGWPPSAEGGPAPGPPMRCASTGAKSRHHGRNARRAGRRAPVYVVGHDHPSTAPHRGRGSTAPGSWRR